MQRILSILAFNWILCFAACAQGCGPSNPNCVVPTAPAGTSTNQAASTAFVANAISGISGTTLANPTASIGLSTINGSAISGMRSDGAPALSQAIVPTWTGTHTFSNSTFSALFSGGPVGILNSSPTAPLHVGDLSASTLGSVIFSGRTRTDNNSVHGFAENSSINLAADGFGMDAYDARQVVTGSHNYDHIVSYQSRYQYGSSGTMTNAYGVYDGPNFTAGTVTNQYGYYAALPTGAGTVTNSYAFYAESYTKGSTLNYAFFSNGTAPMRVGGQVQAVGGLLSGTTTVSGLPTCNATNEALRHYVTDQATAIAYRGAVTGGGTTHQAVLCSNSAWIQD